MLGEDSKRQMEASKKSFGSFFLGGTNGGINDFCLALAGKNDRKMINDCK